MSEPAKTFSEIHNLTTEGGETYKAVTAYWAKPIPIRDFDWAAFVDGQEEWLAGYGRTEEAALADLKEQLEYA